MQNSLANSGFDLSRPSFRPAAAAQPLPDLRPCCPACGGDERMTSQRIGGRGEVRFLVCGDCGRAREARGLEDYQ